MQCAMCILDISGPPLTISPKQSNSQKRKMTARKPFHYTCNCLGRFRFWDLGFPHKISVIDVTSIRSCLSLWWVILGFRQRQAYALLLHFNSSCPSSRHAPPTFPHFFFWPRFRVTKIWWAEQITMIRTVLELSFDLSPLHLRILSCPYLSL